MTRLKIYANYPAMQHKRRVFRPKFKTQTVDEILAGVKRMNEITDKDGRPIERGLIQRWVNEVTAKRQFAETRMDSYYKSIEKVPDQAQKQITSAVGLQSETDRLKIRLADLLIENDALREVLKRRQVSETAISRAPNNSETQMTNT